MRMCSSIQNYSCASAWHVQFALQPCPACFAAEVNCAFMVQQLGCTCQLTLQPGVPMHAQLTPAARWAGHVQPNSWVVCSQLASNVRWASMYTPAAEWCIGSSPCSQGKLGMCCSAAEPCVLSKPQMQGKLGIHSPAAGLHMYSLPQSQGELGTHSPETGLHMPSWGRAGTEHSRAPASSVGSSPGGQSATVWTWATDRGVEDPGYSPECSLKELSPHLIFSYRHLIITSQFWMNWWDLHRRRTSPRDVPIVDSCLIENRISVMDYLLTVAAWLLASLLAGTWDI